MNKIIIIDFGSQYTQLIAKKIRSLQVYCEIIPFHKKIDFLPEIKGIILAGSPFSVTQPNAPQIDINAYHACAPILGICYGAQLIASQKGGTVLASNKREFGKASLTITKKECAIFDDIPTNNNVWMSHGDSIVKLPSGFEHIAQTSDNSIAAFQYYASNKFPLLGLQFHPEVHHSAYGLEMLKNFVQKICNCKADWTPSSYIDNAVKEINATVKEGKVLMALSGGVDSTVAASLIHKAIGKRLSSVFVNNGLLREGEYEEVLHSYKKMGLDVVGVDSSKRFYAELQGVDDPEQKRKIIGRLFIEVFEQYIYSINEKISFLGQGTTYPDIIESISVYGPSVTIKSHHNVGGLPEKMNLKVIEPIRYLFKDEVRAIGVELGVPANIVHRHPFPGPGLAIRIMGEVNETQVSLLQQVDRIFVKELKEQKLYDKVWQAGAVLLSTKSVGVMGDERTYERVVALRAVTSIDGMTADWAHLPYDFLAYVSTKIINEVKGVNRVVYDISSKPPATIEWE